MFNQVPFSSARLQNYILTIMKDLFIQLYFHLSTKIYKNFPILQFWYRDILIRVTLVTFHHRGPAQVAGGGVHGGIS